MKMEEIVQEVVDEESVELRLQLEDKNKQLAEQNNQILAHKSELENVDKDKCILRETTLLSQFPDNIQCIYYGMIDNVSSRKEPLIKFGCSNFLSNRVKCHKNTYSNFRLVGAFRVCNKTQIETAMKKHPILVKLQRKIQINNKTHVELLTTTKTKTISHIDEIIRDIIKNIEYTPENYSNLLEENDRLKKEIEFLKVYTPENYSKLLVEYEKTQKQLIISQEKYEDENKVKIKVFNKLIEEKNILYNKIADNLSTEHDKASVIKKMKRGIKQPDGLYYFDEGVFYQLEGTRQEVWDGIAYKTSGELRKKDLIVGAQGKIVSKSKAITATADNRLMTYMKKIHKV
jgi:hypothetical protein